MELETLLVAHLLDRTTRRVTPTEAGLAYYERCVAILAAVEETEIQVSRLHDEPKGVLKINAPMSFGTLYLGSAVAAQPLSCGKDAGLHRFPDRALWREASVGCFRPLTKRRLTAKTHSHLFRRNPMSRAATTTPIMPMTVK
jgi:hypothetical protein